MRQCPYFGAHARFHHLGLAVRSIREASPDSEVLVNRTQGVRYAFVCINGIPVELLEPLGDRSPIAASVSRGLKLLHVCYQVPDLEAAVQTSRAAGFHRMGPPVTAPEFDNCRIVWLFSRHLGLFELLEAPHQEPPDQLEHQDRSGARPDFSNGSVSPVGNSPAPAGTYRTIQQEYGSLGMTCHPPFGMRPQGAFALTRRRSHRSLASCSSCGSTTLARVRP
jgi:methylmalonyl-CoA/ethylmalonyl-CoA epimerase